MGKPSPPREPLRSDHAWTTSHGEDLGAPSFAYGDSGVDGMALTFLASDECFHSALDELVREPRKEDAGIDSSSTSKGCKGCEASRSVFMVDASPPKPSKSSTDARLWDHELGPISFFICEGCRLPAILSRGRKIANLFLVQSVQTRNEDGPTPHPTSSPRATPAVRVISINYHCPASGPPPHPHRAYSTLSSL